MPGVAAVPRDEGVKGHALVGRIDGHEYAFPPVRAQKRELFRGDVDLAVIAIPQGGMPLSNRYHDADELLKAP